MTAPDRIGWLDVSAGVAGDMMLGALLDAGASLDAVRNGIDAVLPGSVSLSMTEVNRAGLRAGKLDVAVQEADSPHRRWRDIRLLLTQAQLPERVRDDALAVFGALAAAEARVHGIEVDDVHFHEVGALDSIADVVGCCVALHDLGITTLTAGPLALGSGHVNTAHGTLPVPVPAVLQLLDDWTVSAGGVGELATPTGVALVVTLAAHCTPLPVMRIRATGIGAGTRDTPDRANVVRVVIGEPAGAPEATVTHEVLLEANVDDLDPRVWPSVLAVLLAASASDCWLTPILMKKGRPAHTLHVLVSSERADALQQLIIDQTSTIGVRRIQVDKYALARTWRSVDIRGVPVRIKLSHQDGVIRRATAEFEDVRELADELGAPIQDVLAEAAVAAANAGLFAGAALPAET
jgi:uncharacterized protein (TIGR00299 family) protein